MKRSAMRARRLALACLAVTLATACSGDEEGARVADRELAPAEGTAAAPPATDGVARLPEAARSGTSGELDARVALKDAADDEGWDTEVFQNRIGATLKRLAEWVEHPGREHGPDLDAVVDEQVSTTALRPAELREVPAGHAVRVWRGEPAGEPRTGPVALCERLRELAALFGEDEHPHLEFKVVRVVPLPGDQVETSIWVQSYGDGPRHFNTHWRTRWRGLDYDTPLLLSVAVEGYEEVERAGRATLFADCTEAVLGAQPAFDAMLRPGLQHWLRRNDRALGSDSFGHHGLSVADVDGDGLDDLYVCLNGGLPNLLFLQQPDGTALDVSRGSGLDFLDATRSALFCDLDGDGDQDAMVAASDLLFLENDGSGHFELRRTVRGNRSIYSLAAADHDADGDLDLYVCRYVTGDRHVPDPYHDARNGPPNHMLRNDGDWTFTDVTAESGLDEGNDRFSFAASWADYDGDGDLDLYVANDFGRNNLYRNDGGHFRDVAAEAGVEDVSAGMSVAWGDANADGLPDLYVGNRFSSAGNRVAYQRRFQAGSDPGTLELIRRHARGNSLFENAGDGTFRDVGVERDVTLGRWAWSSLFVDADNDGREDLFVANGFISNEIADDL